MMRLELIVEEPSMEEALRHLLPRIVHGRADWKLINMRSKDRLLKRLPDRLRAYAARIKSGEDLKIIVLVDRDSDDCHELKRKLEQMARNAGLPTKSCPDDDGVFRVMNRIAVVELESWFMGDTEALRKTFGKLRGARFPSSFTNPDNGGTWERLHRFLKQHGIYRSSYPKIEAARKIAPHLDPAHNLSRSFRVFCSGIEACLS